MSRNIYNQKIADKRAELARLHEFRQLTGELASYLEEIGDKLDTMKGGTESVALILANWQNVVKSISLASLGLMKYTDKDYETAVPLPEALVRIKLDREGTGEDANTSIDASQSQGISESENEVDIEESDIEKQSQETQI
ncbi:DASH complex subunit Dad2-domain-containing protein [Scheffersomyces xylosifermentans]|uniref:DASH complex subunit Dad2-domain-containing protein n=1 Tax=Scheffersomyces xylosifermentans TaxID=1304137 RepID=UPI00315DF43A